MGSHVTTKNDFNLKSEGHCFFCLKKILVKVKQRQELVASTQFQKYSVHNLARYLEMDIGKVFKDKGQVDSSLLDKVRKSRLKVELCEKCTSLNKTFSGLYRQLEKLEIEMDFSLRLIREKLLGADYNLMNICGNSSQKNELSEIVDVLREEAIQKCAEKLSFDSPRIKIVKLTKKQIDAEQSKHPTSSEINYMDPETLFPNKILELQGNVKVELEPPNEALLSDDDMDSCEAMDDEQANPPPDNMNIIKIRDNVSPGATKNKPEKLSNAYIPAPLKLIGVVGTARGQCKLNPATGKYKCHQCPREFAGQNNFNSHYKSVHLKIRYKCRDCAKEFPYKQQYDHHYLDVHIGIRFKCNQCHKTFTRQIALKQHQRTAHLARRFKCRFCSLTFPNISTRTFHVTMCPERPIGIAKLEVGDGSMNETEDHVTVLPPLKVAVNGRKPKFDIIPGTGKQKCFLCGREFGTDSGFQLHHKTVHNGERLKCTVCEKTFTQRAWYTRHFMNAHMGATFN